MGGRCHPVDVAYTPLRHALAADIQMIIGSSMPLVLVLGFAAIMVLRRRDRRRGRPDDD